MDMSLHLQGCTQLVRVVSRNHDWAPYDSGWIGDSYFLQHGIAEDGTGNGVKNIGDIP